MNNAFIKELLMKSQDVKDATWLSDHLIEIVRHNDPPFQAAILSEKLVKIEHVAPFLSGPASVVANFPKIGMWTGEAIRGCEDAGKAWGQWGVLLRALGRDNPESTENPEIAFSRRGLEQHTRVASVDFELDHLLLVRHEKGREFRVALVYEYDLCANDVRVAWEKLGKFDLLLKTNPNGSIFSDAYDAARSLGVLIFNFREILSFLAKGKF